MHGLMADSKLRIIQSYEQGLVPTGSDKRGPTVHLILDTATYASWLILVSIPSGVGSE